MIISIASYSRLLPQLYYVVFNRIYNLERYTGNSFMSHLPFRLMDDII